VTSADSVRCDADYFVVHFDKEIKHGDDSQLGGGKQQETRMLLWTIFVLRVFLLIGAAAAETGLFALSLQQPFL